MGHGNDLNWMLDPTMTISLVDSIHKLHGLLFKAVLPKASGAKNVNILIEDLHLVCSLATSACLSLQGHHANLQLSDISIGEVFGLVWGHFRQTGDWTVWSPMKFLGPGLGPPGTIYIGLVLVQTQSRLGLAHLFCIFCDLIQ